MFGSSIVISEIATSRKFFTVDRWFTGYRTAKAWFGGTSVKLVMCVAHCQVQHF